MISSSRSALASQIFLVVKQSVEVTHEPLVVIEVSFVLVPNAGSVLFQSPGLMITKFVSAGNSDGGAQLIFQTIRQESTLTTSTTESSYLAKIL